MKDAVNRLPDQIRRPEVNSGSSLHLYGRGLGDKRRRFTQRRRKGCHHHKELEPAKRGRKRELPYSRIRELHEHGLSGAAIAREFRLIPQSVTYALKAMGMGTGRHNHKREVLPNGKVHCSACQLAKNANEFARYGSVCRRCNYRALVRRCNGDIQRSLHQRLLMIRGRARSQSIFCDLTDEDIIDMYDTQHGRCFYTDQVLRTVLGKGRKKTSISIDRIDPGGAYTRKNCVLTTFEANQKKSKLRGEKLDLRLPKAEEKIRQLELEFRGKPVVVTNEVENTPEVDGTTRQQKESL